MTTKSFQPASTLQGTQLINAPFLSAEDKHALSAIASTQQSFQASVDFVAEGVRTDSVYLLASGWACRYKTTRAGGRQITGLIVPGDMCNLDSVMLDQLNFGVRTLTAVTVIALPRRQVQALAAERPGVAQAFTWLAIVENAILSEWALSLGQLLARERLAHLLCEMAMRLGVHNARRAEFSFPLTQTQIADALGLTAVHVNRVMKELRAEGLIRIEGRQIIVSDMAELCRAGGFDGSYLHATQERVGP